jgi:hypothetical protein
MSEDEKMELMTRQMEFITRMVAMWQARRIPAHRALAVIADTLKPETQQPKPEKQYERRKSKKEPGGPHGRTF